MTVDSARRSFPNSVRFAAIGVLFLMGAFASWMMLQLSLWGWWPLLAALSFWLSLVLLFFPSDPTKRKWLGAAMLSGVMLGLGFPPSPFTWIVLFAWIPLLTVENGIFQKESKVRPGQVFLFAFHAFVLWNIIATFWVMNSSLMGGIVANFVNAAFMATVMMIIHLIRHKLSNRLSGWVIVSIWISFEYLHHYWDLSWPWLTLGNSLAQYPFAIQWYEYTGTFGGSLWILLLNYFGYRLFVKWRAGETIRPWAYALLFLIPVTCSLWLWTTTKESNQPKVDVTIVQPNYEPHFEKFVVPQREQSMRFLDLSLGATDSLTKYLVYPETSFEGIKLNTFRENPLIYLFQSLVDSFPNLRLVTGISSFRILQEDQLDQIHYRTHISERGDTTLWDIQNSAIQLTSGKEDYQIYFKSKLVPGPEMFPFRNLLFFMEPLVDQLGGSYEGHTTQTERTVFTGGELNIAPIICYESIYGDFTGGYVRKGATALAIVTNDGWWDDTPGHIQHLKFGAMRAIEHRRPIVRSANSGISAFIDIRGRILQPTKYGEATAIKGKVTPETRITFYTQYGDILAKCLSILSILFILGGVSRFWVNKP